MGFKLWVGQTVENTLDTIIARNYRMASFIPNGRILELDLKRAGVNLQTVFDVGANEGQSALSYLKHFPTATIYCFEPVKDVYKKLVTLTNNSQIKCFDVALGDVAGKAEIYKSAKYNGIGAINGATAAALTESETIDIAVGEDICCEHQVSHIDLLKIDVEGYEIPVLRGLESMLAKTKFIYVEAGLFTDDPCKTYLNTLMEYLRPYNFIVSGFYSQYRLGRYKFKLNHCDVLFTNAALVDVG